MRVVVVCIVYCVLCVSRQLLTLHPPLSTPLDHHQGDRVRDNNSSSSSSSSAYLSPHRRGASSGADADTGRSKGQSKSSNGGKSSATRLPSPSPSSSDRDIRAGGGEARGGAGGGGGGREYGLQGQGKEQSRRGNRAAYISNRNDRTEEKGHGDESDSDPYSDPSTGAAADAAAAAGVGGLNGANTSSSSVRGSSRLSVAHKPGTSIIASLASQLFNWERGHAGDLLVEGMPVGALRKLIARQYSMSSQLLLQVCVVSW